MSDDLVTYDVAERIATITLRRPEKLNAMNSSMRQDIIDSFARFQTDESAGVAILTGEGRAFCAGADLSEMAETSTGTPVTIPDITRLLKVTKPTIAQVNGMAFAGGFLLAQMCDLCTAAETAEFGLPEVRWGRGAPWASPLVWMLPQRVVIELLVTGETLSARRAYELGFVNRISPLEELTEATRGLARTILKNAPLAVAAGKRTAYLATEMGRSAALEAADLAFERAFNSEDALEGPRAFREGRDPRWQTR